MTDQEQPKKIETASSSNPLSVPPPKEHVPEDKSVIPQPDHLDHNPPPPPPLVVDDSKALVVAKKTDEAAEEKPQEGSINRDAVLERVATEKRLSLVKAWEESEKSKAENKAQRKLSTITAWENSKKAATEAELRKLEEQLERKKGEYAEKMMNKIALLHKKAEEKRAVIEAKKGEELLKAEEVAAKYRATGTAPKKLFGLF
ncbi:unnamed protein product [Vicia faba]|uniref:Remorin n=1 Tax=Vicia faba TaxID=3906 RepID=A0AAV1A5M1_VICFA|nr:unnamed protein product [Vicia faba]